MSVFNFNYLMTIIPTIKKEFGIWITNDGKVKTGWVEKRKGAEVRSEIYFSSVTEASKWVKTYDGFKASEVRSAIERVLFANEY